MISLSILRKLGIAGAAGARAQLAFHIGSLSRGTQKTGRSETDHEQRANKHSRPFTRHALDLLQEFTYIVRGKIVADFAELIGRDTGIAGYAAVPLLVEL